LSPDPNPNILGFKTILFILRYFKEYFYIFRIFFETQIFLGFGLGLEHGFFGFGLGSGPKKNKFQTPTQKNSNEIV
jgi:hypothetical protein